MFPRMLIFAVGVVALAIVPLSLITASLDGQGASYPGYSGYQSADGQWSQSPYMAGGTNPLVIVPSNYPTGPAANPLDYRAKADPRFAVPYHDEVQVKDAVLQPRPQPQAQPAVRPQYRQQQQVRPQYRQQTRVYPQYQHVYPQRPRYVTTTPARARTSANCNTSR